LARPPDDIYWRRYLGNLRAAKTPVFMLPNTRPVPFYRHDLGEAELAMVKEVLGQPILTTGSFVEEVEQKLARYLGVRHCLCVTSCTGALHMSLLALGIGPGDEVITTPMTFIATATSIMEAGAIPVFVDVEPDSANLDVTQVEAAITPRTKAIMPVHLFGLMCDMRALRAIADRHGLAIVEDAAHCIEGIRDGIRPAGLGETACFSFYATKNLACGEGGAVATNDTALYEKMRLLNVHGMTKIAADRAREGYSHWDMVAFGWKYNMSNIAAALLLPQFARLEAKLAERQTLVRHYQGQLAGIPGIRLPRLSAGPEGVHAHHLFPIWVGGGRRDEVVRRLQQAQVEIVVNYRAIHLLSYFRDRFGFETGDFPQAEAIGDDTISLPFYPGMGTDSIDIVASQLSAIMKDATEKGS
jgi:dTDP-4-amino-4,6-dideoxygalactose transaminase